VAVEKLDISEIGANLGDRKCLAEQRKSFVEHPAAMQFLRILSLSGCSANDGFEMGPKQASFDGEWMASFSARGTTSRLIVAIS